MARVRTAWQNFPGAPGVTTLYFDPTGMQTKVDAVRAFFDSLKANFPTGTTFLVDAAGDIIDDATGTLTGAWSVGTPPTVVTATGAGNYAGNAGAVVHWQSAIVADGKRLRGRTFLVPLVLTAYDTGGSLGTAFISSLQSAANALITAAAGSMLIWHRPKTGSPNPADDHPGGSGSVFAAKIPDLAVTLRSRRV